MLVEGKKTLVVGLARSGMAAARLLASRGAIVTANDAKRESELHAESAQLRDQGVTVSGGGHPESLFLDAELIVVSPGVPNDLPALRVARGAGVEIISEVELAGRYLKGRLIGVTGSNGKTTTTTLIGQLLQAAGVDVIIGGNIGAPLSALVEKTNDASWTVAELSSFQLENIATLHVNVAVVTNVTPDHLDRHASFDDYVQAKRRIFLNQTRSDWAVLNGDDEVVVRMAADGAGRDRQIRSRRLYFSRAGQKAESGPAEIYLRDGCIYTTLLSGNGRETEVIRRTEIPLPGLHNVENVMAALGATFCAAQTREKDLPALRDAIRQFKGVEHRIEFVAEINGVKFYNDSKATNVDSTKKALEAFEKDVILILGGKDKGSDYTVLKPLISERVKQVVLIGMASDKIEEQLKGCAQMIHASSMTHAVMEAMQGAEPGDTVLLAPACASFDMFKNYEHRGRVFKEEVHRLASDTHAA